ncbi:MAG TPA: sigma-54-dependent Fis family transcriptional regulator [Porticoccaceae bacterium]|nr:sigma-54-dependent Fis family transcriptional regulator [Porticoccaceae bacterium]
MRKPTALIVDDEPDIRQLLGMTLNQLGLEVVEAPDLTAAYQKLKKAVFDICLTDMRLPDGDGLALIEHIQQEYPQTPVAMITAYGNTDIAVEALKRGAFDFVSKPIQLPKLRSMVTTALELNNTDSPKVDTSNWNFVGSSAAMDELRAKIARVARSQAPVYISGESGSGKEMVARGIHYQSPRANGPFIPVNCGAIPSELIESEFFGHKKGSFTGAIQDKQGLFQAADGGTLFLDEVADLPLAMQVKLLRGIQEKAVRPVGSDTELPVDVRILSASHKNLTLEVEQGHFRQDLFYRINVIEIHVPGLRERPEDIAELAHLFLQRSATEAGGDVPEIEAEALAALQGYAFPGNVRELENILERAYTLCDGSVIKSDDLHLTAFTTASPGKESAQAAASTGGDSSDLPAYRGENIDDYLAQVEKILLEQALQETRWNKTAAAEKLGITFRQLRYKLKKLGID